MKKLMIAACAIALAAGAQAAAVTWMWASTAYNGYKNTGTSTSYDGKAAQSGTMYLFNALATDKDSKTINQQYVLTAILAGSDISTLGAIDSYATTDGKMGTSAKKTLGEHDTFAPVRWDDGKAANFADVFYAMVVGDNVFVSDTLSMQIQTAKETTLSASTMAAQSAKFKGKAADGFTAGGWYSASVPEPTSGLLMLLGVAGLALRRRRA